MPNGPDPASGTAGPSNDISVGEGLIATVSWALNNDPGKRKNGEAAIRAQAKEFAEFFIGVGPAG
jgi:hypothetical protein